MEDIVDQATRVREIMLYDKEDKFILRNNEQQYKINCKWTRQKVIVVKKLNLFHVLEKILGVIFSACVVK